jgi:hypothetical protein
MLLHDEPPEEDDEPPDEGLPDGWLAAMLPDCHAAALSTMSRRVGGLI